MDYDLEKIRWHRSPGAGVIDAQTEKICPHAHWVSEQDNILYLADLGCDRIYRYELKDGLPEKELEALVLPTGEGPRQLLRRKIRKAAQRSGAGRHAAPLGKRWL